ncbi:MAG TPA: hypothetical protein VGO59_18030 [Verrucomicrobiae bacterium]|jgi:hypothetical protein
MKIMRNWILVTLDLPGHGVGLGMASDWGNVFKKSICRALACKGVLFEADAPLPHCAASPWDGPAVAVFETRVIATFPVTDLRMALETIRDELQTLCLGSISKISWMDLSEEVWRCWFPSASKGSVIQSENICRQLVVMMRGMLAI